MKVEFEPTKEVEDILAKKSDIDKYISKCILGFEGQTKNPQLLAISLRDVLALIWLLSSILRSDLLNINVGWLYEQADSFLNLRRHHQ